MERQYTDSDVRKLDSVLGMFEALESYLGNYVECNDWEPMFLYSVERFRNIETMDGTVVHPLNFVSLDSDVLESVRDENGKVVYSNNIDQLLRRCGAQEVLVGLSQANELRNQLSNQRERYYYKRATELNMHSLENFDAETFTDKKVVSMSDDIEAAEKKVEAYQEKLAGFIPALRRKIFGNIVADIEEDFLRQHGFNIYDSSKIGIIEALDFYDSKMPEGYTVFPKDNTDNKSL